MGLFRIIKFLLTDHFLLAAAVNGQEYLSLNQQNLCCNRGNFFLICFDFIRCWHLVVTSLGYLKKRFFVVDRPEKLAQGRHATEVLR